MSGITHHTKQALPALIDPSSYDEVHDIDDASISVAKLSDHTKENHDALGIVASSASTAGDADTVDTKHAADFALAGHSHTVGDATTLDGIDSTGFALSSHTQAETTLTFTDVATNNASTVNHGFLPKLDNNAANYLNGQGSWATPSSGSSVPTGAIFSYGGSASPSGYKLCDGTSYGSVDGTHFNVPDLQSKFPLGKGGTLALGDTGGNTTFTHAGAAVGNHDDHTHEFTEIVQHTHTVNITDTGHTHVLTELRDATTGSVTTNIALTADTSSTIGTKVTGSRVTGITAASVNPAGSVASGTTAGSNSTLTHSVTQPNDHTSVQPPYQVVNYIIKT
jgi:hypothetical protein